MAKKMVRRSQRTLTAEEKARVRRVRDQVEAEREEISRRGREVFAGHERVLATTIGTLKEARETLGLSLQDVAERMGTDRANVHRLENSQGNPTLSTLARYADAVGKRMVISFDDNPV
jgi:ribosome-binding protein aMBF1 (putative translation factor)